MRFLIALVSVSLLGACGREPAASSPPGSGSSAKPVVYTTFYPTTYFTERIAGELVERVCPVPEDADPIFWQPSRDVLARYQAADLVVVNGAEFEKWVQQASLPASRVVDTARGFADRLLTYESTTHSHGAGGEHTHEGVDGHTWLDPHLATLQAAAIRDALVARLPEHAGALESGYAALAADLAELDRLFGEVTERLGGVALLASHPAYNYPARRYGWQVTSFDLDPEAPLAGGDRDALLAAVPEGARGVLLWESAPLPETVETLASGGLASVEFSPCELLDPARRGRGLDYLAVMRENLERLEAAASGR